MLWLTTSSSGVMVDKTDGDALLLANAVSGKLITSKIYPLIWDDDTPFRGLTIFPESDRCSNAKNWSKNKSNRLLPP